jgi:hypothetical protein
MCSALIHTLDSYAYFGSLHNNPLILNTKLVCSYAADTGFFVGKTKSLGDILLEVSYVGQVL